MLSIVDVATELLRCAIAHEPESRLLGNLRSCELASLAANALVHHNRPCPKCGAEPWVNIDCDLCMVCSMLEGGNRGGAP